jgi:hypothetical protein
MRRRFLLGAAVRLIFGAILGSIVGGIATGNELYIVGIGLGIPLMLVVGGFLASATAKKRAPAVEQPGRPPGIISTMPEVARPSSGVLLNGRPVGGEEPVEVPAGMPDPATRPRPSAGWRLVGILTIVAGAGLALIPAYTMLAWIGQDIVAGRPFDGRDMTDGLHQQDAFDAIADVMGGTEVTGVYFYEDYLAVSAPSEPGAETIDRYEWRAGWALNTGPDWSQPSDVDEELFDAGDIDMSLVAQLVRSSIADSGVERIDGVYPTIRRFSGEEPRIGIAISGAYRDAYYDYSVTGELLQRSGSAFD